MFLHYLITDHHVTRYKRLMCTRAAIDVQFAWIFGIQIVESTFDIHLHPDVLCNNCIKLICFVYCTFCCKETCILVVNFLIQRYRQFLASYILQLKVAFLARMVQNSTRCHQIVLKVLMCIQVLAIN